MGKGGVETEVVVAKHGVVNVFARGQAVVVADDADPGHVEAVEYGALPHEFFGEPEVREVACVDDEVDVTTAVDGSDEFFRFVIPALGVADVGKTQGILAGALLYNACGHGGGHV